MLCFPQNAATHVRILQNIKSCIFFVLCGREPNHLQQESCVFQRMSGPPGPAKRFACPGRPDRPYFLSVRAARTCAQDLSGPPGHALRTCPGRPDMRSGPVRAARTGAKIASREAILASREAILASREAKIASRVGKISYIASREAILASRKAK